MRKWSGFFKIWIYKKLDGEDKFYSPMNTSKKSSLVTLQLNASARFGGQILIGQVQSDLLYPRTLTMCSTDRELTGIPWYYKLIII